MQHTSNMVKGRNSLLAAALQLDVLLLMLHASQVAAGAHSSLDWSLPASTSSTSSSGGSNSTDASISDADAVLLLEVKDSFSNGGGVLGSWAGNDPCNNTWLGISCDANNYIVSLQLPRTSLSEALVGSLPSSGWKLPGTLESINLTGNNISGTLPMSWRLPISLVNLSLASNRLYGNLYYAPHLPANLAMLDLSQNDFVGSIPKQFTPPPPSEDWIDIDMRTQDPFEGLKGWRFPSSLRDFYLQGNYLSGSLPIWKNSAGDVRLYVLPGNERLCGPVPWTPIYLSTTNSSISLPSCHLSVPSYTPSSSSSSSTSTRFSTSWVAVGITFGVVVVMVVITAVAAARKRARLRAQPSALASQAPDPEGPPYPPHIGQESQEPPPPAFHVGYPSPPAGQTWVHGHPAAFKPPPMVEVEVGGSVDSVDSGEAGRAPASEDSGRPEGGECQGDADEASYPPRAHATPGQSTSVGQARYHARCCVDRCPCEGRVAQVAGSNTVWRFELRRGWRR